MTAPASNPTGTARPRGTGAAASSAALNGWLGAQALNVARHAAALRPFRVGEFGTDAASPTEGHLQATNALIEGLRRPLIRQACQVTRAARAARREPSAAAFARVTRLKEQAHDHVRAVERVWDFYFELFGQRQSPFAPWLLSCDRIALDCYQDTYMNLGAARSIPAPPPFSYMRTGFSPATYRRGLRLRKLGRLANPFPLVQLPYHRLVNPWTLGAVLHEVSHNLQSDLGLSRPVPAAIERDLLAAGVPAEVARVWVRWNRESYADLSGLLLGGPTIVASLMDVVGRSPDAVYNFNPSAPHPTPFIRVLLSCELLRRMGFPQEAATYARIWTRLYPHPERGIPPAFLRDLPRVLSVVVNAICYRPYPALGEKALADVLRFAPKEQAMIEEAADRLARGTDPGVVPERFLIGAARVALDRKLATPEAIKTNFFRELARR